MRVEPLSKLFRAQWAPEMRAGLQKADLYRQIPSPAWRQAWVVHSKSVGHGEKAAAYLADYMFRVGISNQRIVKLENDAVTFWYKERKTNRRVSVTLPVFTFIQHFLQHVLPKGFVKVRYFGFYAPGARAKLALVRELLAVDERVILKEKLKQAAVGLHDHLDGISSERWHPCCPNCERPMVLTDTIKKRSRCPPG